MSYVHGSSYFKKNFKKNFIGGLSEEGRGGGGAAQQFHAPWVVPE